MTPSLGHPIATTASRGRCPVRNPLRRLALTVGAALMLLTGLVSPAMAADGVWWVDAAAGSNSDGCGVEAGAEGAQLVGGHRFRSSSGVGGGRGHGERHRVHDFQCFR